MNTLQSNGPSIEEVIFNYYGFNNVISWCACCCQLPTKLCERGHIKSNKDGGPLVLWNLVPICGNCNKKMSTKYMPDYMRINCCKQAQQKLYNFMCHNNYDQKLLEYFENNISNVAPIEIEDPNSCDKDLDQFKIDVCNGIFDISVLSNKYNKYQLKQFCKNIGIPYSNKHKNNIIYDLIQIRRSKNNKNSE